MLKSFFRHYFDEPRAVPPKFFFFFFFFFFILGAFWGHILGNI